VQSFALGPVQFLHLPWHFVQVEPEQYWPGGQSLVTDVLHELVLPALI